MSKTYILTGKATWTLTPQPFEYRLRKESLDEAIKEARKRIIRSGGIPNSIIFNQMIEF